MKRTKLVNQIKKPIWAVRDLGYEVRADKLARNYRIAENYKRIYHYHIRKSAGTSLNSAFWNLADLSLKSIGRNLYSFGNGYVFVLNSKRAINHGSYFFGSSHNPSHQLNIPENTFTVTVLRSPTQRVLSFYRYLYFIKNDPIAKIEDPFWQEAHYEADKYLADSSFHGFLDNISRPDLMPQLYMFSSSFNVSEAVDQAAKCSSVLFTENFNEGILNLGKALKLPLKPLRERKFSSGKLEVNLSSSEQDRLQEMLKDEIEFYEKVRGVKS